MMCLERRLRAVELARSKRSISNVILFDFWYIVYFFFFVFQNEDLNANNNDLEHEIAPTKKLLEVNRTIFFSFKMLTFSIRLKNAKVLFDEFFDCPIQKLY